MSELREAAQAVVEQWDAPNWKLVVHTGVLIDRLRAALAQPETAEPRDEWRLASEPPEDLRGRVIAWRHPPQRQGGAWIEALYDDGAWVTRDGIAHDITHWRDVQPPTESTIAAKCQRIESDGEICGLTPPCPDCGPSLIDVPEGA